MLTNAQIALLFAGIFIAYCVFAIGLISIVVLIGGM